MYLVDQVAYLVHQANSEYAKSIGEVPVADFETNKDSCVSGILKFIKNPDVTPAKLHQSWMDFKFNDGWTYGPVKDFEKKTHPCLVPWSDLPKEQQTKDEIFIGICKTAMSTSGIYTRSMFVEECTDGQYQISQFDLLTGNRVIRLVPDCSEQDRTAVLHLLNSALSQIIETN